MASVDLNITGRCFAKWARPVYYSVYPNLYMDSNEGSEDGDGKEGSERHGGCERVEIVCLLYADDLVLCGESQEDMRVGRFAEVCRRRGPESQCR